MSDFRCAFGLHKNLSVGYCYDTRPVQGALYVTLMREVCVCVRCGRVKVYTHEHDISSFPTTGQTLEQARAKAAAVFAAIQTPPPLL